MKTTPTPPDMTKEQARELKELRRREAGLSRQIDTTCRAARSSVDKLDGRLARECARIDRAAVKAKKMLAQPIRAEQRQLRTYVARAIAGRSGEARELAAITKRIAVLEGRLGS
ncbi:MAG: hypothetical protein J0626_04900 [Rhodospirillaceae bacterium]|nr:hypothetical protein [Rhodospirillaceae bacterium]